MNVIEPDIPHAPLEAAHIRTVEPREVRELLLRKMAFSSQFSDAVAELDATGALLIGRRHALTLAA